MSDQKNLVVTEVSDPKKDEHKNWDYWIRCEGVNLGIAVTHKGDKPVMKVGETLQEHGFTWLEEKTSRAGNNYFKARRPESNSGGGRGGGGGGGRPDDPATRTSIERQVAAKAASDLLVGFMGTGWKPDSADQLGDVHGRLARSIAQGIASE